MKILGIALIALGTLGCLFTLLSTAHSLNIDVFCQAATVTVTVGASVPFLSGLLLLGGMVLWFLAARRNRPQTPPEV